MSHSCVPHGLFAKNFNSNHFSFGKSPLSSVEILSPEANLSSSHKTKTTSFRRWAIAEADEPRDFLLKTGLKSDFGPVEPEPSIAKSNWLYAVSSDSGKPTSGDASPDTEARQGPSGHISHECATGK
jgi:hypothetical protein